MSSSADLAWSSRICSAALLFRIFFMLTHQRLKIAPGLRKIKRNNFMIFSKTAKNTRSPACQFKRLAFQTFLSNVSPSRKSIFEPAEKLCYSGRFATCGAFFTRNMISPTRLKTTKIGGMIEYSIIN